MTTKETKAESITPMISTSCESHPWSARLAASLPARVSNSDAMIQMTSHYHMESLLRFR